MLKQLTIAVAAVALLAQAAHAQLKVVTTAPEFADLARQIGGDKVEAHAVMMGPENMHNVFATPPHMLKLNKADLFVHFGLDAEPWREPLMKGARNGKILDGQPGNVDMSAGITMKEVPTKVDGGQGDIHAFGNPHYHLDPRNVQRMVATLAKAMIAADPNNAKKYEERAIALVKEFGELYKQLLEELKPYEEVKIATYHQGWVYFIDAFKLTSAGTIENKPGITPSPSEIAATIERLKKENVKVVIVETYNSYKDAKAVADAIGAECIVLPDHVNGVKEADSYQNLFKYNVGAIIAAAKRAGVQPATAPAK